MAEAKKRRKEGERKMNGRMGTESLMESRKTFNGIHSLWRRCLMNCYLIIRIEKMGFMHYLGINK